MPAGHDRSRVLGLSGIGELLERRDTEPDFVDIRLPVTL